MCNHYYLKFTLSFVYPGTQVDMVNLLDLQNLHARMGDESSGDESEKADNDVEMKDAKEAADALADLDLELEKVDMEQDEEDMVPDTLRGD